MAADRSIGILCPQTSNIITATYIISIITSSIIKTSLYHRHNFHFVTETIYLSRYTMLVLGVTKRHAAIVCCCILPLFLSTIHIKTTTSAFIFKPTLKKSSQRRPIGVDYWRQFEINIAAQQQPASTKRKHHILPSDSSLTSLYIQLPSVFGTVEFAEVLYDDTSTAFDAWEWTSNMGAPAALIATAVLVTLSETRLDTSPKKLDKSWVRFLKRTMRFLLLSSFAFEVASIFVGNMTGSMLLGKGPQTCAKKLAGYASPLQLLHHHYE
jgi:hypothetical protein